MMHRRCCDTSQYIFITSFTFDNTRRECKKATTTKSSTHLFLFWLLIDIFYRYILCVHYITLFILVLLGHTIIGTHRIWHSYERGVFEMGNVNKVIDECLFLLVFMEEEEDATRMACAYYFCIER